MMTSEQFLGSNAAERRDAFEASVLMTLFLTHWGTGDESQIQECVNDFKNFLLAREARLTQESLQKEEEK